MDEIENNSIDFSFVSLPFRDQIDYHEHNKNQMGQEVTVNDHMQQWTMQMDRAANALYIIAVSKIRQTIESFLNWLIDKTGLQRASKISLTNGLLVHVFVKLAATFLFVILNT